MVGFITFIEISNKNGNEVGICNMPPTLNVETIISLHPPKKFNGPQMTTQHMTFWSCGIKNQTSPMWRLQEETSLHIK
jgi:hypothetical protein